MFLRRTIEDILENMRGDTEIITVLDGKWADPSIPIDPNVTIIYHSESIGQRAATNEAAKLSTAKYVAKCDAHCAFDEGFDVKMMEDMQDDWTLVPAMKNLHAFSWVCKECGNTRYQGKSGECPRCGGEEKRDVVWIAKPNPYTTSMRFDRDMRFQYWREYKQHQKGDIVETMSLLGAFWMCTREKYFELNLCDEVGHGSWGQQGTEVACKTWLSGGKLMVTKKTWFAHMFRTQGGDFGFPYPNPGVSKTRNFSKDLWLNDKWGKAKYPLSWLIKKFNPPEWEDYKEKEEKTAPAIIKTSEKGIVYCTDNRLDEKIMKACQKQLSKAEIEIVSVSLKPLDFGTNIVIDEPRGYLTLFKQQLAGLEALKADYIFMCDHDVLYHPTHFMFTPPQEDVYYYNENIWRVKADTGDALFYYANQSNCLCAHRETLLKHYAKRVEITEEMLEKLKGGAEYRRFIRRMGFEPGTHGRKERVDTLNHSSYMSAFPNIDIRHKGNLTATRWSRDKFRNKRYTHGWQKSDRIPGWGITKGRFDVILNGIV